MSSVEQYSHFLLIFIFFFHPYLIIADDCLSDNGTTVDLSAPGGPLDRARTPVTDQGDSESCYTHAIANWSNALLSEQRLNLIASPEMMGVKMEANRRKIIRRSLAEMGITIDGSAELRNYIDSINNGLKPQLLCTQLKKTVEKGVCFLPKEKVQTATHKWQKNFLNKHEKAINMAKRKYHDNLTGLRQRLEIEGKAILKEYNVADSALETLYQFDIKDKSIESNLEKIYSSDVSYDNTVKLINSLQGELLEFEALQEQKKQVLRANPNAEKAYVKIKEIMANVREINKELAETDFWKLNSDRRERILQEIFTQCAMACQRSSAVMVDLPLIGLTKNILNIINVLKSANVDEAIRKYYNNECTPGDIKQFPNKLKDCNVISDNREMLDYLCQNIARTHPPVPVLIGLNLKKFFGLPSDDISRADHLVTVVGVRKTSRGKEQYLIKNSWGENPEQLNGTFTYSGLEPDGGYFWVDSFHLLHTAIDYVKVEFEK